MRLAAKALHAAPLHDPAYPLVARMGRAPLAPSVQNAAPPFPRRGVACYTRNSRPTGRRRVILPFAALRQGRCMQRPYRPPRTHRVASVHAVGLILCALRHGRSMLRPYRPRLPAPDHVPFLIISYALVARMGRPPLGPRTAVRVGPLGIPNHKFKRKVKRTTSRYNGSHLKIAVSGSSFR